MASTCFASAGVPTPSARATWSAAWFCISTSCFSLPGMSSEASRSPVLMSTTCTSRVILSWLSAIVPEIILVMPSCSAASISLSPRFSRKKSIFCLEYTRSSPNLLRTVLRPSRVKSQTQGGTSPRGWISITPSTTGPVALGIAGGVPPPGEAAGSGRWSASQPRPPAASAAAAAPAQRAGRPRRGGAARLPRAGAHLVEVDRVVDVLELAAADVAEGELQPVLDGPVDVGRHGDAPGRGLGLDACGDVDAVAEEPRLRAHDLAQVDADADAEGLRPTLRERREPRLDRDRRLHRVDRAVEERHEAVADEHLERPVALGDDLAEDVAHEAEAGDRLGLALAHEPAVSGHVGEQDRAQSASEALVLGRGHKRSRGGSKHTGGATARRRPLLARLRPRMVGERGLPAMADWRA